MRLLVLFLGIVSKARVHSESGHFSGGSLSFVCINETTVHVRSLFGWDLGYGPCGPRCNRSDVGRPSAISRMKVLHSRGSATLGLWVKEVGHTKINLTSVNDEFQGRIAEVNEHLKWELEAGGFDLNLDLNREQTDIIFQGNYWKELDKFQTEEHPMEAEYHLQMKIYGGIRSDTGKHNNGPIALSKPLYSIPLNNVTKIHLVTTDPDGDVVRCRKSEFVELGDMTQMPTLKIDQDCNVIINASVADGFTDGGTIAVMVTVMDMNHKTMTLSSTPMIRQPFVFPLSKIPVQFLVRTVSILKDPRFVTPTPEDRTTFEMYAGAQLQIKLFASPHPGSNAEIESISVLCIEKMDLPLTQLKPDPSREHVSTTVLTWNTTLNDVGTVIIQVVPMDTEGTDGQERNFIVIIKDLNLEKTQQETTDDLHPLQGNFSCLQNSTCIVPVIFRKGQNIKDVKMVNSTSPGIEVSPLGRDGDAYKTQFTMPGTNPGKQNVCLKISGPSSSMITCVTVTVIAPDPCRLQPCGSVGICSSHLDTFQCTCHLGYTGRLCETKINFCKVSPCSNDGRCFNITGGRVCVCKPHWTGKDCDIALTTTLPSTTEVITTEAITTTTETTTTNLKEPSTAKTDLNKEKTQTSITEKESRAVTQPVTATLASLKISEKPVILSSDAVATTDYTSSKTSEESTTSKEAVTATKEASTVSEHSTTTEAVISSAATPTTSQEPTTSLEPAILIGHSTSSIERLSTTTEKSTITSKLRASTEAVIVLTDIPSVTEEYTKTSEDPTPKTESLKPTTDTAPTIENTKSSEKPQATSEEHATSTAEVITKTEESTTSSEEPPTTKDGVTTPTDKSSTILGESTTSTTEAETTLTEESTISEKPTTKTESLKPTTGTALTNENTKSSEKPQATSEEHATSTTTEVITKTEESTTNSEEPPTTKDAVTTPTDKSSTILGESTTSTTEAQTTLTEESTISEKPTTKTEASKPTTDTALTNENTKSSEKPQATSEEHATSTTTEVITKTEESTTNSEEPSTTNEAVTTTTDKSSTILGESTTSTTEAETTFTEESTISEKPTAKTEASKPTTDTELTNENTKSSEKPQATSAEHATSTTTEVITKTEESTTNSEEPPTTNEAVTTTTDKSSTILGESTTSTAEAETTFTEESTISEKPTTKTEASKPTTDTELTNENTKSSEKPQATSAEHATSTTTEVITKTEESTTNSEEPPTTNEAVTTTTDKSSTILGESTTSTTEAETTFTEESTISEKPTTKTEASKPTTDTELTNENTKSSEKPSTGAATITTETLATISAQTTSEAANEKIVQAAVSHLSPEKPSSVTSEEVKTVASTDSSAKSPGSTTASSSLSSESTPKTGSCTSAPRHKVEQAAVKKKLRCSCTHPQTKKTVHVVTPVASTKELAVATGAGFGAGSVVILFSGLVYVLVQKYKTRQKSRNLGSPQSIPHSRSGSQDYSDSPNYNLEEKEAPSSHPNVDEF